MLTMPAPSPQRSRPGACSRRGSEWKPPLGIVFAPHSTRSPPATILRVLAAQAEAVERHPGQMALRSLGEHRDLRDEVGAGLEVAQLAALPAATLVSGAHAQYAAVGDEQLLRRGLGEDHRSPLLGTFAEETAELREGEDPVAVIPHRRRRRDRQRRAAREDVDGLAGDGPERRDV